MSKYDKIFEARSSAEDKPAVESENKKASKTKSATKSQKTISPAKVVEREKPEAVIPATKQRGRPPAKRSDPDFIGFTTYIRKNTHLKVKIALLQEGEGRELSELVEELFNNWLESKK